MALLLDSFITRRTLTEDVRGEIPEEDVSKNEEVTFCWKKLHNV